MWRTERRRALGGYVTGLLLDGERKSIEPMAARLAQAPAQTEALCQPLLQCMSGAAWGRPGALPAHAEVSDPGGVLVPSLR
nr:MULTISPECIES: transposase [Corallococcus]